MVKGKAKPRDKRTAALEFVRLLNRLQRRIHGKSPFRFNVGRLQGHLEAELESGRWSDHAEIELALGLVCASLANAARVPLTNVVTTD